MGVFLYCIGEEHPAVFYVNGSFRIKIKDIVAVLLTIRKRKEKDWDTVLLYKTGIHIAEMAERVYEAMIESYDHTAVNRVQTLFQALPIKSRQEMNVTGNDLLNWANKKPGPWVAEMIQKLKKQLYKET